MLSVSALTFHHRNPCSQKEVGSFLTAHGKRALTVKVEAKDDDKNAGKATYDADFRASPPRFTGKVH